MNSRNIREELHNFADEVHSSEEHKDDIQPSKKPKITIIPPKQLFIDLTIEDTINPSPKLYELSPSAPNAPSKTPSTKDTSSSSIDYTPKSPTLSSSPSTNGYLNPPLSPPPKVPPSPPTQASNLMEITLSLSPITLLVESSQCPYQYKQVLEPGDDTVTPPVPDTYRLQNGTELTKTKRKQVEADDQAIHILLVGLLDDVYAVMDSFQTINEMWNRIQRLKKGTKIRIQEKRITLLDELEKFTSIEGETIASLVRISQKSQEYSQNQANTGTRIRRVQSRSQKSPNP
ncbi:hypothetical protein Tco_1030638 [Tanacetum coccineum]|uniref:Uncharacterized protein n=1 Tax=Tanacetum coccineum TaxID=301880 RepID=A0ABQ5G8M9_9ASTR